MSDLVRKGIAVLALLVALALPLLLDDFWLQTGLFAMAAVVGAIGLTLLVGQAGQLSLGHAFFAALGAYAYAWIAGATDGPAAGLGLPPVLGLVGAGIVAALAGALAALAGIFLVSFPASGVAPTVALSAFAAIPAWVLGGFDSIPGAIVGGLIVGIATSLAVGVDHSLADLLALAGARDWADGVGGLLTLKMSSLAATIPFALMLLILLVRPTGLMGDKA